MAHQNINSFFHPLNSSPAPVAQLRRHPNARNLRTVYHSMMEFADVSHSENTQRLQCFPDLSDTAAKLDATVNPVLCAFDEGQQKPAVQVVAENTPNHLVKFDPSDISSISIDKQPALADRTQPAVRQELNTLPEQIIIIPTLQDLSAHPTIRVLHHNQTESRHAVSSPSKLPTPTASPLKPKHATPDSALVGGPQLPASPSGRQKRAKSLAAKSAALTTALAALRAQREREQQHVAEHGAMSFSGSLHDIAGGLRRFVSEVNGASLPPAPAEMQPALVEHLQTLKGAGKFAVPPGQVASAIKKRRIEAIDTALGLMGAADAAGRKLEFDEKDGERSSGTEREVEDVVVKMEGVDGPEPRKRTVSGKRSRPMIAMPDGILLSERKKRTLSRNQPASSFTHDARSTKRKEAGMTGGAMDATALLSSAAELLSQTEAAEALAAATLSGNSLSTAELANLRSVTSSPVSDPFSDGGQSGLDLLALLAATGAL
ncbi:hypothetical protein BC830DRAFT_320807 [Chytriomyces sp. MP71]|nr:hypothetical protein BC830DRAFT_320807 [Chytriomyces sp. MP71]